MTPATSGLAYWVIVLAIFVVGLLRDSNAQPKNPHSKRSTRNPNRPKEFQ